LREFDVNIIGLSKKAHLFNFTLKDGFFEKYGKEVVSGGDFDVQVVLDKKETFIEVDFNISGKAHLVCDRSLEPFDYPIEETRKVVFKYGEVAQEISDEIVVITRDQDSLDLGQFIYEFIALSIPIKKLHPRFKAEEEDDESDVKIIYRTSEEESEKIDPRWEKLKKLK
jgi:uncharacterized protein